ncbi:MAG: cysteine desulfurase [Chloroflexia bacterium]|nr:cysteine desulfurase [Chloroflexia bacterium]
MRQVYLDHAATTPIRPEVLEAMRPYIEEHFGNPLSLHRYGEKPRQALEEARERVAALIGAQAHEIYFTASGSESNNMAVKGVALMARSKNKGQHVVISAIEHQSVLYTAETLGKLGFEISQVPVDEQGRVDPQGVEEALRDDTVLVSIMLANNEIGSIQPLTEIAERVRARNIPLHSDAVAAVGRIPVHVDTLGVDLLSLSGSQFYGPKGAAALYMRRGTRIMPLIDGGIQERGRRAGTENVAGIVGMGRAAELAMDELEDEAERLRSLRDHLVTRLTGEIPYLYLTGHPQQRLPNHVSITVGYIEGEAMLLFLNMQGIAASSGSTCTSRALKASHVLTALGIEAALAQGSLVFTMGRGTSAEDVDYVADTLAPIVERLRQMSPLWPPDRAMQPSDPACHPHEIIEDGE